MVIEKFLGFFLVFIVSISAGLFFYNLVLEKYVSDFMRNPEKPVTGDALTPSVKSKLDHLEIDFWYTGFKHKGDESKQPLQTSNIKVVFSFAGEDRTVEMRLGDDELCVGCRKTLQVPEGADFYEVWYEGEEGTYIMITPTEILVTIPSE